MFDTTLSFMRNSIFVGECLTPKIIYHADITTDNDHKFCYGPSETSFKHCHSNHTRDFKHVKYQHATEVVY